MKFSNLFLCVVLLTECSGKIAAITTDPESLVASIELAISKKDWAAAQASLDELKNACKEECVNRYTFTAAFYYHQRYLYDTVYVQNKVLFDNAVSFYSAIIRSLPGNDAPYRNLALLHDAAGNTTSSIIVLQQGLDETENNYFLLLIGDRHLKNGDKNDALTSYSIAADDNELREQAYERIVRLFRQNADDPEIILGYCKKIYEHGFTRLSLRCLTDLMGRYYVDRPVEAEAALVWWAYLTSKKNRTPDVGALPSQWQIPPVKELRLIMKNPGAAINPRWWENAKVPGPLKNIGLGDDDSIEKNLLPKNVIAQVLQAKASRLVNQDSVFIAEQMLVTAYNMITERDIYHFLRDTKNIPDVFFQLAGDLGVLYTQNPELPMARDKFDRLIRDLFEGKNSAYISNMSNEGVMKFHTTLGLIYAERQEWYGGGIANGIFQLSSAISKSPPGKNTGYLNLLLSEGYRQRGNRHEEGNTLLTAAEHFLNDDDFSSALDVLTQYHERDFAPNARLDQLTNILKFRSTIDELQIQRETYDSVVARVNRLTDEKNNPGYFDSLQRFKIFSDLGTLAKRRENSDLSVKLHSKAIQLGYDLNSLGNISDIDRLDAQKRSVSMKVEFEKIPSDAAVLKRFSRKTQNGQHSWIVYDNDGFGFRQVSQTNEVLVGAEITLVFKSGEWTLRKIPVRVGPETIYYTETGPWKDVLEKAVADLNFTIIKL